MDQVTQDKNRVRSYDKKERVVQLPQAVIERIGGLTKDASHNVTDVGHFTKCVGGSMLSLPK